MPQAIFFQDLSQQVVEIAPDSIVSRTLFQDAGTKVILFGFAPGQELSEHTSARTAILHFLSGEGTLKLGEETHEYGPGTWAYMPPHLSHSIFATSETRMVLIMLA